jgi:myosin-1
MLFKYFLGQSLIKLQKPSSTPRSKPAVRPLPGKSSVPAVRTPPVASSNGARVPPAQPSRAPAPPPPPPPPEKPDVELYKAKFAFEGQEGEMSLKKDDIVELVEKDDNGWWLVRQNGQEGWTPHNYLELVPPKPKVSAAPPPLPANRRVPAAPPLSATASNSAPRLPVIVSSLSADSKAKPVSVFPGMGAANGSPTPWKKAPAANGGSDDASPGKSHPSSSVGAAKPPPVASKPKPGPPVAPKPGAPKIPAKPAVPAAPKPPGAGAPRAPPKPSGGTGPSAPVGQLDLAAAVSELSLCPMCGL